MWNRFLLYNVLVVNKPKTKYQTRQFIYEKNKLVVNKPKKKQERKPKKIPKRKKNWVRIQIFLGQAAFLGSLYLYYCVSGSKQLAYIVIIVKLRRINQIDKTIN